jgi:glycosyltransferase involved in cell wall biosynthesis
MNKNVLIIQRRLPQYRLAFFDWLRELLSERDIELSLVHGEPAQDEKAKRDEGCLSWARKVPCKYLKIGNTRAVWMTPPADMIRNQDLIIMSHENGMLINFRLTALRLAFGKPRLAFWGHGANFQSIARGIVRAKIKSRMISRVDWYFAYTDLSVARVAESGFDRNRITCLNNAIDTRRLVEWNTGISGLERDTLLKELGLTGAHLGIFIGSLHQDKRLDVLFAAADLLRKKIKDFELLVIGDGPLGKEVAGFVGARRWAKWVGAKHGREKVLYASLGQIMLNPGMVGLGILDSFALAIPMVTTDCGIHSPEIAYLETGRNGFMVSDTQDEFVGCVAQLLGDPALLERVKSNCRTDAQKYTIDKMAGNFCEGIIQALRS